MSRPVSTAIVLATCLAVPSLVCALAVPASASHTSSVPRTQQGLRDLSADEGKKRVPKAQPEDKKKADEEKKKDEGDDSGWFNCFASCLDGLFSSSDNPSSSPGVAPGGASAQAPGVAQGATESLGAGQSERLGAPSAFSMLGVSWFAIGPRDLNLDYKHGGAAFDLEHLWNVGGRFLLGPRIGYAIANGTPQFGYVTVTATDSTLDSPTSSKIQIADFGIHVGHQSPVRSGEIVFRWEVGPTLYWVKEQAKIDFIVLSRGAATPLEVGARDEWLERWRLGGNALLGVGFPVRSNVIGLDLRIFAIPWESGQKRSLTLDWIGKKSIVGLNLGLTFGHVWR